MGPIEVDVFVATRGQRARRLVVDMPIEEFQKKEISLRKGHQTKWEKDKLVHQDVVNELWNIQEMEEKPLEMCMDVLLDLGCAKSIIQPRGLNKEAILQSTRQVHLTKDDNRSTKMAKENDVHVELT